MLAHNVGLGVEGKSLRARSLSQIDFRRATWQTKGVDWVGWGRGWARKGWMREGLDEGGVGWGNDVREVRIDRCRYLSLVKNRSEGR